MISRYDLEALRRDFESWGGMTAWEPPPRTTPRNTSEVVARERHMQQQEALRRQGRERIAEFFSQAQLLADQARGTSLEEEVRQLFERVKRTRQALLSMPDLPRTRVKTFYRHSL